MLMVVRGRTCDERHAPELLAVLDSVAACTILDHFFAERGEGAELVTAHATVVAWTRSTLSLFIYLSASSVPFLMDTDERRTVFLGTLPKKAALSFTKPDKRLMRYLNPDATSS